MTINLDFKNIERLWSLVEKRNDVALYDSFSEIDFKNTVSATSIKNCLLAIVYISFFEPRDKKKSFSFIFLPGGPKGVKALKVDLQKSDGRENLFWSISRWGKDFPEKIKSLTIDCPCQRTKETTIEEPWKKVNKFLFEHFIKSHSGEDRTHEEEKSVISDKDCTCQALFIEQCIEEVTVGESWKRVTLCLLSRLIECHPGEGFLPDMTPVINLIILSGKHFQMKEKNFTENLFSTFIKQIGENQRDRKHLHGSCPYNEESTIDVLIRYMDRQGKGRTDKTDKLFLDLRKLNDLEVMPNQKWANFVRIMDREHGRGSIKMKIEKTRKKLHLGTGYWTIEEEIKQMADEQVFRKKICGSFVPIWECGNPNLVEEKITENVIAWVNKALNACEDYSDLAELTDIYLSGSVAEGCRLRTEPRVNNDEYEIDLAVAANLDVQPVLTDEDLVGGFMGHHNHRSQVQIEFGKIQNKNPFPHVGWIILKKDYKKRFGHRGDSLKAGDFFDIMTKYIYDSLVHGSGGKVPFGLDPVENIRDCLKQTGSGIELGFTFRGTKVSVDIVSVIPIQKFWLKEIVKIFPGYDSKKLKFLEDLNCFSCRDGIISKEGAWRLSWSNSEARLLRKCSEGNILYKTLKYLASVSGQHFPSYFIKELTLSYIIHTTMNNVQKTNIIESLNEMLVFAENNGISNPFYSNKLGSKLHQGCYNLLNMFLIAKCSIIHQGSFEQVLRQESLQLFKEKGPRKRNESLSHMLSSMFHDKKLSPSESVEATVKGSVEDISSQEKIKRLAAELGRELDRSGDSQIRRQVMRMISNTELCSRRGHLNASFISDEGNVSGSETSSVLQTEAVIENYQLPEITEEIAREDDTIAIVEEADQFLKIHPQHQVENEPSEAEVEQESG